MNWELLLAGGTTLAALVLAFLYVRAERKAALTDQMRAIADHAKELLNASQALVAHKEEYIRELEKTVLGTLPAGKLADRLNLLFTANRSGTSGAVPTFNAGSRKTRA